MAATGRGVDVLCAAVFVVFCAVFVVGAMLVAAGLVLMEGVRGGSRVGGVGAAAAASVVAISLMMRRRPSTERTQMACACVYARV